MHHRKNESARDNARADVDVTVAPTIVQVDIEAAIAPVARVTTGTDDASVWAAEGEEPPPTTP